VEIFLVERIASRTRCSCPTATTITHHPGNIFVLLTDPLLILAVEAFDDAFLPKSHTA
jgi:hypothetical protein